MTRGRKSGAWKVLGWLIALVMAGGILYLQLGASSLQKTYRTEAAITPEPTKAPPAIYASPTEALLRSGSIGPEVLELQEKLKALGYYSGELDGQYGKGTAEAVTLFQSQHDLTPDGMAGQQTLGMIYSEAARHMTVTPKPVLPDSAGGLPILVNRQNPVQPDYVPSGLVNLKDLVPEGLIILKDPNVQANREATEALIRMIRAAQTDGLEIWQVSEGYRTLAYQQELYDKEIRRLMEDEQLSENSARGSAERSVALPGTSEHHTGLAFDLTVPGYYFGDTKQAIWLEDHCFKFGFILRYTANKEHITGFDAEPWHVRYVGEATARFMEEHNLALEEYLALYQ